MHKYISLTLVVLAFAASQLFAIGEARITGKVVDGQGKPVPRAKITVTATEQITFKQTFEADAKGNFAIFLLNGTIPYNFLVEKEGFEGYQEAMKLRLIPEKNEKTFVLNPPAAATVQFDQKADPAIDAYNEGVVLLNESNALELRATETRDEAETKALRVQHGEKTEAAIARFEESTRLNPQFAPGWKTLALAYGHTKNWKKVIETGVKALELNPDDEEIASVLSVAYDQTGDKVKAAEFRKKAPSSPVTLFNEAAQLINAQKDKEAEPLLKQAIAADANFSVAYYELGMLYARLGKNADARTNLEKYIELDPKGKDAATAKEMLHYVK